MIGLLHTFANRRKGRPTARRCPAAPRSATMASRPVGYGPPSRHGLRA